MRSINPLLLIDFYKADHRSQYPPGTELVYSNFTPRKSRIPGVNHMTFFGLQYILKEYLVDRFNEHFFSLPKDQAVGEYDEFMRNTLSTPISVDHIADLHDLGYLPLCIMALPEGTNVPLQTPAMVFWNTSKKFYWLTNYLETLLSALLWKPCTSATIAGLIRNVLDGYAKQTSDNREFVDWQGHDFSFRGMSGVEDACMSGAGHLLHFKGTDTVPAIQFLRQYYDASFSEGIIGGSVPATEHSVMSAGGKENELDTIRRLLKIYPEGIISIVSDTWDLFKLVNEYLPTLKDEIMGRNGKIVCRPDSGRPHKILNGNPDSTCELEKKGVIRLLHEHFGGTVNSKGYIDLDSHVGTIYGDGINLDELRRILIGMAANGYSSANCVFGIGSYTYQYVTRDTLGTVCKATYVEVNGQPRPIFKSPKTGAWKKSHKGLLCVNPDLSVEENVSWDRNGGIMEKVFYNGRILRTQSLNDIRSLVSAKNFSLEGVA